MAGSRHHRGTRHLPWLGQLRFDDGASQATFDSFFLAVQQCEERQRRMDAQLAEFGDQEPYREPVGWLRCFLDPRSRTAHPPDGSPSCGSDNHDLALTRVVPD